MKMPENALANALAFARRATGEDTLRIAVGVARAAGVNLLGVNVTTGTVRKRAAFLAERIEHVSRQTRDGRN